MKNIEAKIGLNDPAFNYVGFIFDYKIYSYLRKQMEPIIICFDWLEAFILDDIAFLKIYNEKSRS
jgi:hypothetical protein